MLKRTITATAAGIALLAGGVTMATPAMAAVDVTVRIGTGGIDGWSYTPPSPMRYQLGSVVVQDAPPGQSEADSEKWPGHDSDDPMQTCGGLADPWYSQTMQICYFTVPTIGGDSQTFANVFTPSWKVKSPFGKEYWVAQSSSQIFNEAAKDIFLQGISNTEPPKITVSQVLDDSDGWVLHITPQKEVLNYLENQEHGSASVAGDSYVGAAADVETENSLGAAPNGDASDDVPSDDGALPDGAPTDDESGDDASADDAPANDSSSDDSSNGDDPSATVAGTNLDARILRSKTLTTGDHQVVAKHHTRVEKMAAKVHNRGGVLTIHAYGPDEDLALARARAVRAHLEAQLAKRGHTESSPIWVTYAGDPDHKKDTHVTVHWHPDTTLPGALSGVK
jgi:hemin uptake protein HemP